MKINLFCCVRKQYKFMITDDVKMDNEVKRLYVRVKKC